MKAVRITRDAKALHGRGQVRVAIGPLVIESDEATLDTETDSIVTRGHARATLPARSDRHLFRCGARAVVTEEPVLLMADRIDVKDGLLRARGHVEVKTASDVVRADEMDLFLNLGDGEARGNVRLNGERLDSEVPRKSFGRERRPFPPEIIR